ncbi:4'-phosphopantetheinyl transferase superfamily protein [Colwellia demingiae]|uniref:4'-phosphopantetheinyl transferase superfamily protein n=1 Tax=Colwellia demingiae TaxID=89401 RepID=A0A5C6QAX8_9GAMM|nr:4'-phosphopantetheinyl transferase superfamily protein [Colwellia demingiae]TWX65853.1 4'-phosphopantetheinyl transferase superfamily protein [Colwellia demingiae]
MTSFSQSELSTRTKEKLDLATNEIHIWVTKPEELLGNDELLSTYSTLLTATELAKQQRYKFAKDRHDALITRAFIRDLLSYYADVAPQDWQFEKGNKDKPEVINCPLPLRFNISHTKNLIICAVTLEDDIGCDVENTGRNNNVLAIAERYFSSKEIDELFALPEAQQRNRFFDYWTLKESYIKAWGLGLAIPLADFSFEINDTEHNHNDLFTIKQDINLSFAEHRVDEPQIWRSWLVYPTAAIDEKQEHRIALSLRTKSDNQKTDYQLRFFNTLPLLGYQEI